MTFGRQLSFKHSSKKRSANCHSPLFSQALIRLLYVMTLLSQPCHMGTPSEPPHSCAADTRLNHPLPKTGWRRTSYGRRNAHLLDHLAVGVEDLGEVAGFGVSRDEGVVGGGVKRVAGRAHLLVQLQRRLPLPARVARYHQRVVRPRHRLYALCATHSRSSNPQERGLERPMP